MKHPSFRKLTTIPASLLIALLVFPVTATSAEVVSQQLTAAKDSEAIAAVLWTRRADRYTLQVVFPRSYRSMSGPAPKVTLWLLAGDGTVIPVSNAQPLGTRTPRAPNAPTEAAFSVPLASGERAVAAAIRVDEEFFIEPLQLLHGD